jgi:hypothetical protein
MLAKHLVALERVKKKRRDISTKRLPSLRLRSVCFIVLALFICISTVFCSHGLGKYGGGLFISKTSPAPQVLTRKLGGSPPPTDDHAAPATTDDDHATDDHATDDHGSDDSHAFALFGAISALGVYSGTIAVLIIVLAVQCVEYFFHMLHALTHDTPFSKMVQIIEKELMVVGFTAFIFKIMVNTTSFLDLEWFHALEYAGEFTTVVTASLPACALV